MTNVKSKDLADIPDLMTHLVRDGYMQTSARFRCVARLPEGKTGLEALRDVAPNDYARIMGQAERNAADEFRRIYAERCGLQIQLGPEEFAAFKKAGGQTSW